MIDRPEITTIILTSGLYDFQDEIYVHGKTSIIGQPGTIMRLDQDMSVAGKSEVEYTYGGWIHLGTMGKNNEGLNQWYDSVFEGIEFQMTSAARCSEPFFFSDAKNVKVQNNFWNVLSTDSSTDTVDSIRDFIFNGHHSKYKDPGEGWGTLSHIHFIRNRIITDDNEPNPGDPTKNAAVGIRLAGCEGVICDGNTIIGTGDDCIAMSFCDGVTMVNNYGESLGGRFLADESQNVVISHNRYKRIATRDSGTDTGIHDGASSTTVMVDSLKNSTNGPVWVEDSLVDLIITNTTKSETATIISNTGDTITSTVLSGGADWDATNTYSIANTPAWKFGGVFGAKTIIGETSFTNYEESGEHDMYCRNYVISHNIIEFPVQTAGSSQGIFFGGLHGGVIEGNILLNYSTSFVNFIQQYEDGVQVRSPGLPLDLRINENVIIRGNICHEMAGSYGGRLRLQGIDQYTVTTLTRTATGGTFTLGYTDWDAVDHVTQPITCSASLSAATIQTALRNSNVTNYTTDQGKDMDHVTVTGPNGGPWDVTWIEIGYRSTTNRYVEVLLDVGSLTGGTITKDDNTPTNDDPGTNIIVENNICDTFEIVGPGTVPVIRHGNLIADDATETANQKIATVGGTIEGDGTITKIIKITQEDYDLLNPPDATTYYVIVG
jgi:hypothetical protein